MVTTGPTSTIINLQWILAKTCLYNLTVSLSISPYEFTFFSDFCFSLNVSFNENAGMQLNLHLDHNSHVNWCMFWLPTGATFGCAMTSAELGPVSVNILESNLFLSCTTDMLSRYTLRWIITLFSKQKCLPNSLGVCVLFPLMSY